MIPTTDHYITSATAGSMRKICHDRDHLAISCCLITISALNHRERGYTCLQSEHCNEFSSILGIFQSHSTRQVCGGDICLWMEAHPNWILTGRSNSRTRNHGFHHRHQELQVQPLDVRMDGFLGFLVAWHDMTCRRVGLY